MSQFVPSAAGEDPDLVTTGTRVPYIVKPDADLNPNYDLATDGVNPADVNSTFTWTIPAALGTINNTPLTKHYLELNVTGAAGATLHVLNVKEQSGASCPDATGTNINIRIVARPNISAAAVTDASGDASICAPGSNGSLNVPFPTFNITPSIDAAVTTPAVKVKATLTFTPLNGVATDLFTNATLNVDASGNISNTDIASASSKTDFDNWGTYTLTYNYVSDKVSRKDIETGKADSNMDNGYFAPTAAQSATYYVYKTPVTGPVYHIGNTTGM
ncbi:MAG TPA: hypothetical protein VHO72_02245 [Bacteroidales bacterium]|nr:hypothetical protein [Bacteroidales bacterium]